MEGLIKRIGRKLYKIEVENPEAKDPVFEIVRSRAGGAVQEDSVDRRTGDPSVNSKDPQFVETAVKLGLGEELFEKACAVYGESEED